MGELLFFPLSSLDKRALYFIHQLSLARHPSLTHINSMSVLLLIAFTELKHPADVVS